MAHVFIQSKNLSRLKNCVVRKCFSYFIQPLSILLQHCIILHLSKIGNSFAFWINVLAIFHSSSKTISLAEHGGNNGNSWWTYTKLRFQSTEKNLLRARIIGNRCNVLLQVSSHVTILLMFILFVLRQKSEQSLERCVHVFLFHYFAIDSIWMCRIVLSMIIIVYVEIGLQLRFIHYLQNTSWIYTVPSMMIFMVNWIFHWSIRIISTVQFLWSHMYVQVVIKYMLYKPSISVFEWLIVISIHLTGNVYSTMILCLQYMY